MHHMDRVSKTMTSFKTHMNIMCSLSEAYCSGMRAGCNLLELTRQHTNLSIEVNDSGLHMLWLYVRELHRTAIEAEQRHGSHCVCGRT